MVASDQQRKRDREKNRKKKLEDLKKPDTDVTAVRATGTPRSSNISLVGKSKEEQDRIREEASLKGIGIARAKQVLATEEGGRIVTQAQRDRDKELKDKLKEDRVAATAEPPPEEQERGAALQFLDRIDASKESGAGKVAQQVGDFIFGEPHQTDEEGKVIPGQLQSNIAPFTTVGGAAGFLDDAGKLSSSQGSKAANAAKKTFDKKINKRTDKVTDNIFNKPISFKTLAGSYFAGKLTNLPSNIVRSFDTDLSQIRESIVAPVASVRGGGDVNEARDTLEVLRDAVNHDVGWVNRLKTLTTVTTFNPVFTRSFYRRADKLIEFIDNAEQDIDNFVISGNPGDLELLEQSITEFDKLPTVPPAGFFG